MGFIPFTNSPALNPLTRSRLAFRNAQSPQLQHKCCLRLQRPAYPAARWLGVGAFAPLFPARFVWSNKFGQTLGFQ